MIVTASEKFFPFEIEELFALWATQAGEGEFSIRLEAHLKSIRERESLPNRKRVAEGTFSKTITGATSTCNGKTRPARNKKRFPKNIF